MRQLVFSQDFNWHDELETGTYHFGDKGYLVMDGTEGRIQCNRLIRPAIVDPEGAVELRMRFVLGRSYALLFYNHLDQVVVRCVCDDEGWIRFHNRDQVIDTGKFLTYSYGIPAVDPQFRSTKRPLDSDEHRFRFDQFNSAHGTFRFWLDDAPVTVEGAFEHPATEVAKVELQTLTVEPGAVIRVRSYARHQGDTVVGDERFAWDWGPVAPPPDGYPYDHVCETRVRPVDYRWLQTNTQYGWLWVRFTRIALGEIEFELMTPDIKRESVILLEEDDGTFDQGQRLHAGILREKFIVTGASEQYSKMFDRPFPRDAHIYFDAPKPEPNQVYTFRVAWNERGYRMWVNDIPMEAPGRDIIPYQYAHRPFKYMNTLTLHPGMHGTRLSLEQKRAGATLPTSLPEPHLAYWGKFRIYDLS
jgi:hypothetical protein